jgi:CO/xanthine dehydrogenase Mo-binding subunit
MDGPAPAILNALEDALGVSINQVPVLPEMLMETVLSTKGTRLPIGD